MTFKETIRDLANHGKDLRVLYVEDDPLIRENTHTFLSMIFTSVDTACNGKEGLELYEKEHHDLVISDVLMPEMNGIEMSRRIKNIDPSQSIVITSATEESSHLHELMNIGVSQFILKPMQIEQVGEVLHTMVMNLHNTRKLEVE